MSAQADPGPERERQQQLREQYEATEHADHYAERRWTETGHARRTDSWERRTVAELLIPLGVHRRLLDLPCGHGRFGPQLEQYTEQLIQGDLAAAMLARRQVAETWAVQASLLEIPYVDDAVDLAFCFRVLHHFPEPELRARAIAELGRVSRRWVLTTYYDAQSFPVWRDRVRGRARTLTSCTGAQFKKEAAAAGLRIVARRYRRRWISQQVIVLLEKA